MNKQIISVAAFLFSSAWMAAAETKQAATITDVTSQYVTNSSFETDELSSSNAVNNSADGLRGYKVTAPASWTVSGTSVTSLLVTKDCYTDNNFGKMTTITDGKQAYYLRQGWASGSTTLQQTLKNLPAGKYKLTADVRSAYNGGATSSYALFAGSERVSGSFSKGSSSCFTSMDWSTQEIEFSVSEAGDVNVGIMVNWVSGGSCISIDNVHLYQIPDSYVEPEDPTEAEVTSPREGVINNLFVGEAEMKDDLMNMLAKFAKYLKNDWKDCASPNSVGEACGAFKCNSTMNSNEDGVRSNADLSMISAFLVKYGKDKVALPEGVTWNDLETMAMKSLVFAYSTHKANKLKVCSGNQYWGSTSNSDHVWESSLWAMSVAYSAFFQWDKLSDTQKGYIEKLLKAECNYELERSIPTGYKDDTKAEENGWEADVLAATLGLFPHDELAPKWFERLREFAINSYSHRDDANNTTIIDPEYDNKTVADLYVGQNLYDDYTLQNHSFFHTSYQNVVMQELGEAALALKLFQQKTNNGVEKWKTNALMHNNDKVMKEVLNWLALADGELAMPNGNDWSLFLYDQLTSYTTNACFLNDPDALMLENLAYKYIKARQTTTADGSWLLRSDIGARRMGVEGHRVMMTWLMHELLSTADATPSEWDEFNQRYAAAKIFDSQNVVRASTPDRFTCFSWSPGKSSYTGYIAANSVDQNKIIVPYRANNTGNFLGWYEVSGKTTNATPVVNGIYNLRGNSYTMNGELNTNDAVLNNRFAIYSTPGNAVIYTDYVRANADATISKQQGGLMAISTDELTRTKRTLYYGDTHKQTDGTKFKTFDSKWVNIDNALGVVNMDGSKMGFGDNANNNSINTSKLYASYSDVSRALKAGSVVDKRNIIYYSNVNAETTKQLMAKCVSLKDQVPAGWNGVIATDPDNSSYMLLANFCGDKQCSLKEVQVDGKAPVFTVKTTIRDSKSSASFSLDANHSKGEILGFTLQGTELSAIQDACDSSKVYLSNQSQEMQNMVLTYTYRKGAPQYTRSLKAGESLAVRYSAEAEKFMVDESVVFPSDALLAGFVDVTEKKLANANFEKDTTYGDATGNVTLGSTTYSPCYVNQVAALDAQWPNVLPVEGWQSGLDMAANSKFVRMFSMPYSSTMYCVSPKDVGNFAAQCESPAIDENSGKRMLTVLNSWAKGKNAITQKVALPAGEYRLVLDMKYECPNQTANDGKIVTAQEVKADKKTYTNTSLTGIKIGAETDYRYPAKANEWQKMVYDFTLESAQEVELSLGYASSGSYGAANNTLLYIDNVCLGAKQYSRNVKANSWNTICLPYTASPTEGVEVYEIAGINAEKTELYLSPVAEMTAGVPYIFYSTQEVAVFAERGNAVSQPVEGSNGLVGVFDSKVGKVKNDSYILKSDVWYKVDNESRFDLGNNRAYIAHLEEISPSAAATYRSLRIAGGDVTGITGVVLSNSDEEAAYTMQGIKAVPVSKGIIIKNGKKQVNR